MPNFHRVIRASEEDAGSMEKDQVDQGAGITNETPKKSDTSALGRAKEILSELPSMYYTEFYFFLYYISYF